MVQGESFHVALNLFVEAGSSSLQRERLSEEQITGFIRALLESVGIEVSLLRVWRAQDLGEISSHPDR